MVSRFSLPLALPAFVGQDPITCEELKTGTEATREVIAFLCNGRKKLGRPYIVGVTGFESETHNLIALAAGQDHVLGKPVQQDELVLVLGGLFAKENSGEVHDVEGMLPPCW